MHYLPFGDAMLLSTKCQSEIEGHRQTSSLHVQVGLFQNSTVSWQCQHSPSTEYLREIRTHEDREIRINEGMLQSTAVP